MLINLIRQHALEAAETGDFAAVAATLNALAHTVTVGRVGGKASLSALVAAGIDPSAVITAMRSDPMASELLNTLTASGVDWADDLTALVMGRLVESGKITQRTADIMRSLSVRSEAVISTTAEECEAEWVRAICGRLQNESINPAIASGDRAAIVASLRSAADALEAG